MSVTASNDDPPVEAYNITPSDTTDLPQITRCIYVGTAGNVRGILVNSTSDVTYVNVQGRLSGRFKKIFADGTTAQNIIGEF